MSRSCMWINETQNPDIYGGYVPSLVNENEAGHRPMLGKGEHSSPWVWGKTLKEAQEVCIEYNKQKGISEKEAFEIVTFSMFCAKK